MKKRLLLLLCMIVIGATLQADVKVTDVSVKPRYPWNGLVDITYSILCGETDNGKEKKLGISFTGYDVVLEKEFPMTSLTCNGAIPPVKTEMCRIL